MKLFVYGTLMCEYRNHAHLYGATYIRMLDTTNEYTLVSLGQFPGMLEGGKTYIQGELYDVPLWYVAHLDILEDADDFYYFKQVNLTRPQTEPVYAYFLNPAYYNPTIHPTLKGGQWR